MKRRRAPRTPAGVTLLELLVAVAILGTISGVLYGTFSRAIAAREHATAAAERYARARVAVDWLESDLTGSFSSGLYPSGAKRFLSRGRADEPTLGQTPLLDVTTSSARGATALLAAEITAEIDAPRDRGDQVRVLYHLESPETDGKQDGLDGYDLVRYEHRPPAESELEEASRAVIARGLAAVELRFFDGAAWFEDWDSAGAGGIRGAAPRLVEIRIRLAERADPIEIVSSVYVVLGGRRG